MRGHAIKILVINLSIFNNKNLGDTNVKFLDDMLNF